MAGQIRSSEAKEYLVKDQHETGREAPTTRENEASWPQAGKGEAKRDGRWNRAYSPPTTAKPPEDFIKALQKNQKAETFFKTLNRANVYSLVFRLENAKDEELRRAKIKQIIRMFEEGEKFH